MMAPGGQSNKTVATGPENLSAINNQISRPATIIGKKPKKLASMVKSSFLKNVAIFFIRYLLSQPDYWHKIIN